MGNQKHRIKTNKNVGRDKFIIELTPYIEEILGKYLPRRALMSEMTSKAGVIINMKLKHLSNRLTEVDK